jgi:hypothetical protein
MSYYNTFQQEHYGNILNNDGFTKDQMPVNNEDETFESDHHEAAIFENYTRQYEETLLREMEADFPYK